MPDFQNMTVEEILKFLVKELEAECEKYDQLKDFDERMRFFTLNTKMQQSMICSILVLKEVEALRRAIDDLPPKEELESLKTNLIEQEKKVQTTLEPLRKLLIDSEKLSAQRDIYG